MNDSVILGLDPTQCDGFYPRTRDDRCQGCGIVGKHPPKLDPDPSDVWVFTDERGDRTLHVSEARVPLLRLYPGSSVCRYVPAARLARNAWDAETRGMESARKIALQCAVETTGEESRRAYNNIAGMLELEIEKRCK